MIAEPNWPWATPERRHGERTGREPGAPTEALMRRPGRLEGAGQKAFGVLVIRIDSDSVLPGDIN